MRVLPNLLHFSKMRETDPRGCSIWNPQYDKKTSEIHQLGILVIWPAQDKTNSEMGLSGIHIHYVAFFHAALTQFKGESSLKLLSYTKADSIYLENFEKEVEL